MSIDRRSPRHRSQAASILVLVSGLPGTPLSANPSSLHAQKPDVAYIPPNRHDRYQAVFCNTKRDKQSQENQPLIFPVKTHRTLSANALPAALTSPISLANLGSLAIAAVVVVLIFPTFVSSGSSQLLTPHHHRLNLAPKLSPCNMTPRFQYRHPCSISVQIVPCNSGMST